MKVSDFDFSLPDALIASHPLAVRDASRMLVVGGRVPSDGGVDAQSADGVVYSAMRKTRNYLSLPYNPKLTERAKALRKSGSLPEALFWKEIKSGKINGLDFDRQKIIGNYIVDFFCASHNLVIEIDDKESHDFKETYDAKRDDYLKSLGLSVIHIPAIDVLKNMDSVIARLVNHPGPSPQAVTDPPLQRRGTKIESHVMEIDGIPGKFEIQNKHITDFVSYLRPGDVVVFNNSRVIPARFDAMAADGNVYEMTLHTMPDEIPPTGICDANSDFPARGEFIRADLPRRWWALCKKFGRLNRGDVLKINDTDNDNGESVAEIVVLDKNDNDGLLIEFLLNDEQKIRNQKYEDVLSILNAVGKMPLPPYMKRENEVADRERYQTVYADPVGSMAAPTAGLHFTPEILAQIQAAGATIVNITLHVGAGTWMPVKTDDVSQHKMHSEWGVIRPDQATIINTAKARGGRVIAIGTTSTRLLESAATHSGASPFCGTTNIFITPGYKFKIVDVMLTNFHLPKSTLFMLVSAFTGVAEMRAAYRHAIDEKYRFFSYGDACLLFKKEDKTCH